MGLIEAIGKGPVGLDTPIFIYFIERHPAYYRIVEPVFNAIVEGRLKAVTSTITLIEVLVVPYRAGRLDLAELYEEILGNSPGLHLAALDLAILRGAAMLRARTGLKTPDAIQLAVALKNGCTAFLTNDRRLPDLEGLSIVQISS